VILESNNETGVQRWMKPGIGQFRIEYAAGQSYEPDFVVETDKDKFIVEIKAKNELSDAGALPARHQGRDMLRRQVPRCFQLVAQAGDCQRLALPAGALDPVITATARIAAIAHFGDDALQADFASVLVHLAPFDLEARRISVFETSFFSCALRSTSGSFRRS
jgi:hypothetical protein